MNPYTREDRPALIPSWRFQFRCWLIEQDIRWVAVLILAIMAICGSGLIIALEVMHGKP